MDGFLALCLVTTVPYIWASMPPATTQGQPTQRPVTTIGHSVEIHTASPFLPQLFQRLANLQSAEITIHAAKDDTEHIYVNTATVNTGLRSHQEQQQQQQQKTTNSPSSLTTQTSASEHVDTAQGTTLSLSSPDAEFLKWLNSMQQLLKSTTTQLPHLSASKVNIKEIVKDLISKHEDKFHTVDGNIFKVREYFSAKSHATTDELPSPGEFFGWLDSIHPLQVNQPTEFQQTRQEDEEQTIGAQQKTKLPQRNFISTNKLIILSATVSGTFILFIIVFAIIYCRRQKQIDHITVQEVGRSAEKEVPGIYQADGDTAFMGIPANNNIWKEIQMLSASAPAVFTENDKF